MSFPQIYNLRNSIQEALSIFVFQKKEQVRTANYLLQAPTHGLQPHQIKIEKEGDFIILSGWNNSYEEPIKFEQILKIREGSKIQNITYSADAIQINLSV